jgi:glycosyltransferase involved in cell wall biosynthesis
MAGHAFMTLKPVRITVASSGLGHVARGIEAWASDLGRALDQRGEQVTLAKGGGLAESSYERVIPCSQRNAASTRRLLRWLPRGSWRLGLGNDYQIEQVSFALGLLRHLRQQRVHLLHVQDPIVALVAQRARRLGWVRTKTILAHGTEEPPQFLNKITYLQHLAPVHLDEARAAGAWKPTWTAIPNFVDTTVFHPGRNDSLRAELGIPAGAFVILTAAAIKREHKRIDYLIQEFAALLRARPAAPVWLIVAGGREQDTADLVKLGNELLGDRVRFLVSFPRNRMADLYRVADAFVLCSLKEMMPIALLEATASGLPCIVNRHDVMRWMIGRGGEAVDMAAAGALTGSLIGLLADAGKRQQLAANAREHCERHFATQPVVDQILRYYRFVLCHVGKRQYQAT